MWDPLDGTPWATGAAVVIHPTPHPSHFSFPLPPSLPPRSQLSDLAAAEGLALVLPPPRWCVDNGVMVAWAGHERLAYGFEPEHVPPLPAGATDANGDAQAAAGPGLGEQRGGKEVGSGGGGEWPGGSETEWVDVKPRWPLTARKHPRCGPVLERVQKVRQHVSLDDMTKEAAEAMEAAGLAGAGAGMAGGESRQGRGGADGAAAGAAAQNATPMVAA